MHLGGARWAAVGDSPGPDPRAPGRRGDPGVLLQRPRRADRPVRPVPARRGARVEPTPEDGYGGEYIDEIARAGRSSVEPDALDAATTAEAQEVFRREGVELMFAEIKQCLHDFGVDFDVYFHENDLHDSGAVERAVARLRELGHIYEADGAIWLRTTEFGDDKDRVIIKSDGEPTYFAGDLAYYLDKRERGFDRVVIMLGADHHGYIGRMMAMCACFGDDPGVNLEILIGQLVNLVRDGQPVRMSKRAGTVITHGGPGRGGRRRRRPLRAGPLLGRLADRHRPRPADPAQQRQPGLLRAVRPRAHGRCRPQRGRGRGVRHRGRVRPVPARRTRPRRCCSAALGEFPRVRRPGRRAARAAPGGALPGGAGRHLPPLVRQVPGAARTTRTTRSPTCTAPGCGWRGDPDR